MNWIWITSDSRLLPLQNFWMVYARMRVLKLVLNIPSCSQEGMRKVGQVMHAHVDAADITACSDDVDGAGELSPNPSPDSIEPVAPARIRNLSGNHANCYHCIALRKVRAWRAPCSAELSSRL